MKLLYLFAGLLFSFSASAQLQNLNFENWDNPIDQEILFSNSPTGWVCSHRWFGTDQADFGDKFNLPIGTDAQNGDYAIKLFTWYNYMKDAAVQTATINSRPSKLKGFYKYEENFIQYGDEQIIDTAEVVVVLTKWNAALAKKDTVGFGKFSTYTATSAYKEFVVNVEYFSAEMPDSITILLDPSIIGRDPDHDFQTLADGGISLFTVDNLSLEEEITAGIDDVQKQTEVVVHPNPAKNQLNFSNISGEGIIYDLTGKKVSQFTLNNGGALDIAHLNVGLFIVKITNDDTNYTGRFIKQ